MRLGEEENPGTGAEMGWDEAPEGEDEEVVSELILAPQPQQFPMDRTDPARGRRIRSPELKNGRDRNQRAEQPNRKSRSAALELCVSPPLSFFRARAGARALASPPTFPPTERKGERWRVEAGKGRVLLVLLLLEGHQWRARGEKGRGGGCGWGEKRSRMFARFDTSALGDVVF
jgi:hypothetical protein